MALNPQYVDISKSFVDHYYKTFDKAESRGNLVALYSNESFMTFEGEPFQGQEKIAEKLNALAFQKIDRIITAIDSQPMYDGGVFINVLGRLKSDEDPPHGFMQSFILKPAGGSFFILHDQFRLAVHNTA